MSTDDVILRAYYAERAPVYDQVYRKPERQADLRRLQDTVSTFFAGRRVLEIACGTGYWTQYISPVARSIVATDVSLETLQLATARNGVDKVDFRVADAYRLGDELGRFDAAFAALWVSHVPRQRLRAFFKGLHRRLRPGSPVLLIDNSRAQCMELPITATDEHGNTYQTRVTDNQTDYRVLKNFPEANELTEAVRGIGCAPGYEVLEHFWTFRYTAIQPGDTV